MFSREVFHAQQDCIYLISKNSNIEKHYNIIKLLFFLKKNYVVNSYDNKAAFSASLLQSSVT